MKGRDDSAVERFWQVVDVDFHKRRRAFVFRGQPLKNRRHFLARLAPPRGEIYDQKRLRPAEHVT